MLVSSPLEQFKVTEAVAVLISIGALLFSYVTWRRTMVWTLQKQLSDATTQIGAVEIALQDVETQVVIATANNSPELPRIRTKRQALNEQRYSLAGQADYLLREMPRRSRKRLVSGQQYAIVARALSAYDDSDAGQYWQEAIDGAKGRYRIMYQRDYAKFLFSQGRSVEGREFYATAVSGETTNERVLWEKMWVFIESAKSEKNAKDEQRALASFERAREIVRDHLGGNRKAEGEQVLAEQHKLIFS